MRTFSLYAALIGVMLCGSGINISQAAEQEVYGWQLMNEQEREQHRIKMRSFRSEQEREAYRLEHHKRMQERAKEMGVALPDEPQPMGKGMRGGEGGGRGTGGGGYR